MKRQEKATYIIDRLEELYPETLVPLDHTDAYTLLIAVLLSAQCTDKRVNLITPHLFQRANNPFDMAQVPVSEIQDIIRPCGLSPMKSKGISGLSKILVEKYNGEVPQDLLALEELPSVGHKTAQVVVAQAFGIPSFPVDTHIHRLATRWKLTSGKNVVQTERDLKALFPVERWNKLHLQIIFYGREHCSARGCDGRTCEICATVNPRRSAKKNQMTSQKRTLKKKNAAGAKTDKESLSRSSRVKKPRVVRKTRSAKNVRS